MDEVQRLLKPNRQRIETVVIGLCIALAASVALSAVKANAAEPVACRRIDLQVALSPRQPAEYSVTGELCSTPHELRRGSTVQLLIHGETYNQEYWTLVAGAGLSSSYARAVAAGGLPTFAFDEIGTGGSSHPPSRLVTLDAAAHVAHQIVLALRSGALAGTHFRKVITVGHSLGAVVAWEEAIRYADVAGVIVTGAAHSLSLRYQEAQPTLFSPATADARFATTGLDEAYLTTVPGVRTSWFLGADAAAEEAHKDVVTAMELASARALMATAATRAIRVPVLIIMGSNDAIACGPNAQGRYLDCSSGAALARQESRYYSREARLQACVVPDAGHDLNLTPNHNLPVVDALAWSAAIFERGPSRETLPANCGSTGKDGSPGSRYTRTALTNP